MEQGRFDWGAILRAIAVIIGVIAVLGFIVPVIGAVVDGDGPLDTGNISGHEIYRWGYWVIAWGLVILQGSWMLRNVHERIIDDMLVTSVVAAVLLVIVRIIISLVYESRTNWLPAPQNDRVLLTFVDAAGAMMMVVVGFIGARVNRY